jgi:molecular chaperone GrpE (heat shock protein)
MLPNKIEQEERTMFNWLKSIFGKKDKGPVLQLEREVQSLRTMLDEQDKVVAKLKKDLHQLQSETEFRAKKFIQTKFEELMAEAASPITQIHTQAHLVEEKNRPLNVRDVIGVAKQFERLFQNRGLRLEGYVGEITSFDPDHHRLLKEDIPVAEGEPVIVRFVGVAYRGKLLTKAAVDSARSGF